MSRRIKKKKKEKGKQNSRGLQKGFGTDLRNGYFEAWQMVLRYKSDFKNIAFYFIFIGDQIK